MRDLALQAAGVLAILVAITHSIIVERKVFASVRIEPPRTRGLLRMLRLERRRVVPSWSSAHRCS